LFTKYFDFTPYLNDDTWYFSDTISYIGANYIKSKSEEVLDRMCSVIGIDRKLVEENQNNSGGAQKLMKNIDHEYWAEVYKNSRNLYDELVTMSNLKKDGDPYGIQVWTASMWSELWTAWKLGHEVRVPDEFDFCWATCHESKWGKMPFMHNAGVINNRSGMFYKAEYVDKLPYNTDLKLDNDRCSYHYYSLVQEVGKKSVLL
jgi:hypothetical protein